MYKLCLHYGETAGTKTAVKCVLNVGMSYFGCHALTRLTTECLLFKWLSPALHCVFKNEDWQINSNQGKLACFKKCFHFRKRNRPGGTKSDLRFAHIKKKVKEGVVIRKLQKETACVRYACF